MKFALLFHIIMKFALRRYLFVFDISKVTKTVVHLEILKSKFFPLQFCFERHRMKSTRFPMPAICMTMPLSRVAQCSLNF